MHTSVVAAFAILVLIALIVKRGQRGGRELIEKIATKSFNGLNVFLLHGEMEDDDTYCVTWKKPDIKVNARLFRVHGRPVIQVGDLPTFTFMRQDRAAQFFNCVTPCEDGVARFDANRDFPRSRKMYRRRTYWNSAIC